MQGVVADVATEPNLCVVGFAPGATERRRKSRSRDEVAERDEERERREAAQRAEQESDATKR